MGVFSVADVTGPHVDVLTYRMCSLFSNTICSVWQTSLDLMSQDVEERRRQKLQAFKELAERLDDERNMMDYRRNQIEARKEAQVCVCA